MDVQAGLVGHFYPSLSDVVILLYNMELSNFVTCPVLVNGQNPLGQPRFTFLKIDIFSRKHRGASDEYPQHMFSLRNKKKIYVMI